MSYITEADLASYLQVDSASIPVPTMAVTLANGLIEDLIDVITPAPTTVLAIALEVAARGWRNPQGFTSVTVGIDDYDKTVRREGKDLPPVGVYLTDDERATLLSYLGVQRRRVGSIRLSVPDAGAAGGGYGAC